MKFLASILRALPALSGLAALGSVASATTITANDSDLILGFRAAGGAGATLNLEVDLGPASQFYDATPGEVIDLSGSDGLALADLTSTYGNNWSTRTDLFFGIIGGTGRAAGTSDGHAVARTIWATVPETVPGTLATPWLRQSSQSQGFASADIESLYSGPPAALSGQTSTANSNVAAVVTYDGTVQSQGSWSYEDLKAPSSSFNIFNPTIDIAASQIGTQGSLLDGTSYAVLDLYELQPNNGVAANGVLLGSFGLNSAGNLVFDTDSKVFAAPEPGSISLFAAGALLVIGLRRRPSTAHFSTR